MLGGFTSLWQPVNGRRRRASSYDVNGGNNDFFTLEPGTRRTLLERNNCSGYIMRMWFTLYTSDAPGPEYLTNVKIRCAFDGQITVEDIPFGMFTGTGPWRVNDLSCAVINVMRARLYNQDMEGCGNGSFNINWSMPFSQGVEIQVKNDSSQELRLFLYIDYMEVELCESPLLFHAHHRVESPTTPAPKVGAGGGAKNLTNQHNYEIVNIQNQRGRYVGTILAVESHPSRVGKWYEGDDMFLIDGEKWPPSLHGTGTEDYFGMAWGVHRVYQALDHGVTHYERAIAEHDRYYDGRFVLYRWHLFDPIVFHESLHASIEAGHANECAQHYESVAFWYSTTI